MNIRRRFYRFQDPEFGDEGESFSSADPTPSEPAGDGAGASAGGPSSLYEAMFGGSQPAPDQDGDPADAAAPGQPRDERGRFAPKDANGNPIPQDQAAAQQQPSAKKEPGAQEDLTAMPEGLGPKAQERFQRLANENRELSQRTEQLDQQVSYIRETFQEHGVTAEQFQQATAFIGAVNRGDFDAARQVLAEQMQFLSVAMGKPMPGVDALAGHADLRQAVDALELTEERALELARARMSQQQFAQQRQQQLQQQQEQQARQQQELQQQQVVQQSTQAVDAFCKRMMASDVDYPEIEKLLAPEIPTLLAGVPPQHWARTVEAQYRLLKQAAGRHRSQPSQGTVLRPTGTASPQQAPRSAYEAMWGTPAPKA